MQTVLPLVNKSCLSDPAEFTSESSSVKIWSVKPLPAEKYLNSLPSQCIISPPGGILNNC